jgi:hypothetical protein
MTKKTFAITSFMTAITICLTITSCKKDDANNSNSIVGKWKRGNYFIHVYGGITDTVFVAPNKYVEFTSGGKYYDGDTSNYVVSGDKLIVSGTGYSDTATIETLNANNLTLNYKWTNPAESKKTNYTR